MDRLAIRVGLLEQTLIESVAHLSFGYNLFRTRNLLLVGVHIYIFTIPSTAAESHFATRFGHQIGLCDVALNHVRHLADDLHDIFPFLLDGAGKAEHVANLLQNAVQLAVEVHVVVDHAQVGMASPCFDYFLIEHACNLQSFLICTFITRRIIRGCIELFCTVGSTHQVEHGVVAGAEFRRAGSYGLGNVFPYLGLHIGRYIHRAAIADDDGR